MVPFEIAAQAKTKAQPKTGAQLETETHPGTTLELVQSLFAPHSSLDMHLPFSLS